jgi:hypothetical protein
MQDPQPVLDYAGRSSRSRGISQRVLYCLGLPLLAGGLIFGLGRGGDVDVGTFSAALGALLISFALPVQK